MRYRELLKMHDRWARTARRLMKVEPMHERTSWQEFASIDRPDGESQQPLTHSHSLMARLENLNSGFCLDVNNIHQSRHRWYFEDLPYRMDCTLLLVKILNNLRWARLHLNAYLINTEPGFPLMNHKLGTGPTMPEKETKFGNRDRHFVVSTPAHDYFFVDVVSNIRTADIISVAMY